MNTRRLQPTTDTEPTPDRTATAARATPSRTTADPRTATDRAPRTFSHRNGARLENLIDEFNAAFANETSDEAA